MVLNYGNEQKGNIMATLALTTLIVASAIEHPVATGLLVAIALYKKK